MEGGGAVTVQKGSVSFGQTRPRSRGEPSSPAGLCLPSAPGADQQSGGSAGSCSVCSAAARGGAAGPGSRIENHRCGLVGRERRGRGAAALDSSFVASQRRCQRMPCLRVGSAVASSSRSEQCRAQRWPLLAVPGATSDVFARVFL